MTAPRALASTTTPGLLRAAYSLTHQIDHAVKAKDKPKAARLREQRKMIEREILRRTGEA